MRILSTILGRIGTSMLSVCLVLIILLHVPPIGISDSITTSLLEPGYYSNALRYCDEYTECGDRTILRIHISSNGTFKVYIMNVRISKLIFGTVQQLNDFIKENPDKILVENVSNFFEYTLIGTSNTSVIIANEGERTLLVSYRIKTYMLMVPTSRTRSIIVYLVPLGIILTMQWVLVKLRHIWK